MSDQRRPPMRRAAGLGVILQDWLQQRGVAERLQDYRAWQLWNEVVGPQIAARAQPSRIRNGVLEIKVDQPVWMQQLQLMKPQLLARLNDRLGAPVFHDLYLRRGQPAPPVRPPARHLPPPPLPLPAATEARIEEIVGSLTDTELRQRLRGILRRQAQLEERQRSVAQDPSSP
jgi:hypothetical protein